MIWPFKRRSRHSIRHHATNPGPRARSKRFVPTVELLERRELLTTGAFLQGTAFIDVNQNNHLDPGEPYLPNATVRLYTGDGSTLLAQTTTDTHGAYLFDDSNVHVIDPVTHQDVGLTPGTYRLVETPPANYVNQGVQILSQLNPATGLDARTIQVTVLDPSQASVTYNSNDFFFVRNKWDYFAYNFFGNPNSTTAGQLPISVNGGPQFLSYCWDLVDVLDNTGTDVFPVLPTPGQGTPPNADRIAYLYNHYGTTDIASKPDAVGLQVAIWELEYGSNFVPLNGILPYTDPTEFAAILNRANFYVNDSLGKSERATFLDATEGGTITNSHGRQGMIATGSYDFGNVPAPDVDVTKTADQATINAGGTAGFTIKVFNEGAGTATGVTLNDPLPAGLGHDINWHIDPSAGNASAFVITGAVGSQVLSLSPSGISLAAGASLTVHITGLTSASDVTSCTSNQQGGGQNCGQQGGGQNCGHEGDGQNCGQQGGGQNYGGQNNCGQQGGGQNNCGTGTLVNTATVNATNETTAEQNDHASATITILGATALAPDVDVIKTADHATIVAGDLAGYTIKVFNEGTGTATGVTLSDRLPAGLGNDINWSIDPSTGNPSAFTITGSVGNQVLTLSPAGITLGAGASLTVHIIGLTRADDVSCCTSDQQDNQNNCGQQGGQNNCGHQGDGQNCGQQGGGQNCGQQGGGQNNCGQQGGDQNHCGTGTLVNTATVNATNEVRCEQNDQASATITILGQGGGHQGDGQDCGQQGGGQNCGHQGDGQDCGQQGGGQNCGNQGDGENCGHQGGGQNCGHQGDGQDCGHQSDGQDCGHQSDGQDCGHQGGGQNCGHQGDGHQGGGQNCGNQGDGQNCGHQGGGQNCGHQGDGQDCGHQGGGQNCGHQGDGHQGGGQNCGNQGDNQNCGHQGGGQQGGGQNCDQQGHSQNYGQQGGGQNCDQHSGGQQGGGQNCGQQGGGHGG